MWFAGKDNFGGSALSQLQSTQIWLPSTANIFVDSSLTFFKNKK
jgi:hypothetical protein